MIEITLEGFKILVGSDGSRQIMIDSSRIDECIQYAKQNDLRFIGINSFMGYSKTDIGFLAGLADFVEGVSIPEGRFDLAVVNTLYKLKRLGFADNKKTGIDLSNFSDLEHLACEYSPRLLSLETCKDLKTLTLTGYKPLNRNLLAIPSLPSLEELDLFVTNIADLKGIERFSGLKKISFYRARNLEYIDGLQGLRSSLISIEFDQCKRIESYHVLSKLGELRRLLISSSHSIDSLEFLNSLQKLEFFSFVGTTVVDGDLSPALGISYVGFNDMRHYSHKFKDFQTANQTSS